jgi:hypothetical protein
LREESLQGQIQLEANIVRIAYLTLDEVNQHLALNLADEQNVCLEVQARPDNIIGREYDAVIYDPDSFPPNERPTNLTTILTCPLNKPVAVHSYCISPDQADILLRRGALTARQLGAGLFLRLLTDVRAARRQQTVA